MNYTDDGYAAMLLTMALSPDREEYARPLSTQEYRALAGAARSGERVFLRIRQPFPLVLRGHAVSLAEGRLLVNLGFGIGLVEAVRAFNLTDADFAPDDLAMELLFLHEANRAVLAELSGFTSELDMGIQELVAAEAIGRVMERFAVEIPA